MVTHAAQRKGNPETLKGPVLAVNFPGHFISGHELLKAAQLASGRQHLGAKPLPWGVLKLLGVVSPVMRSIAWM